MVQSQVVSITPAVHADKHRHGGTDPLTGDVRIDGLGFQFDGSEIVASPFVATTWTNVDISAITGAHRILALVRFNNDAAVAVNIAFRAGGETDWMIQSPDVANQGSIAAGVTAAGYIWVITNAAGEFEYYANGGYVATLALVAWQVIR